MLKPSVPVLLLVFLGLCVGFVWQFFLQIPPPATVQPIDPAITHANQQRQFTQSLMRSAFKPEAYVKANFAAIYQAALSQIEVAYYPDHRAHITSISFSPDGQHIASADAEGNLHMYPSRTAGAAQQWQMDKNPIYQLEFNPKGEQLLTLSQGGILRLWRLADGQAKTLAYGHHLAHFHPNGDYIISVNDTGFHLWHRHGEHLGQYPSQIAVHFFDFSPQGDKLLSLGNDKHIRVWQMMRLSQQTVTLRLQNLLKGHNATVNHARFDESGNYLLSGADDARVLFWNLHNGGQLLQLDAPSPVLQVGLRPDKKGFFARSSHLQVWQQQGKMLAQQPLKESIALYSDSAKQLLSLQKNASLQRWSLPYLHSQQLHLPSPLLSSDYHAKSGLLLSHDGERVHLWQTRSNLQLNNKAQQVHAIALSPDNDWIALASETEGVWLQHRQGEQDAIQLYRDAAPVYSLLFSPDGEYLFYGTQAQKIEMWRWRDAKHIKTLHGQQNAIVDLQLRPDGQQFFSRSLDHDMVLWSITGEQQAYIPPQSAYLQTSLYLADSQQLCGLYNHKKQKNYRLMCWGTLGKAQQHLSFDSALTQASAAPDHGLVVDTEAGAVYRYQASTGLEKLWQQSSAITALHYSPDKRYLFSAALDGNARLWDASTQTQVYQWQKSSSWVEQAQFSPDSRHLWLHDYQGNNQLWQLNPQVLQLTWQSSALDQIVFSDDKIYLNQTDHVVALNRLNTAVALKAYAQNRLPRRLGIAK